jgi:L-fuculose-phosphate aldolase
MSYADLQGQVYETAMMLVGRDLIRLSAGNISLHDGEGHVAITPAGLRYDRMKPSDIPIVDLHGNVVEGELAPSSETPMHTMILREISEMRAVVHTHSRYAIAFAITATSVPAVCLELLSTGAPVPVAPYTCPGSEEAGRTAIEIFRSQPDLKCLMLRNHGLLAIGPTLYSAYESAYKFETGAEIYHLGLQIGQPIELTTEQIAEIAKRYQKPKGV